MAIQQKLFFKQQKLYDCVTWCCIKNCFSRCSEFSLEWHTNFHGWGARWLVATESF